MISKIPLFYIFGANTDIGKTIFSTGLCKISTNISNKTTYLKPIQTGFPIDSDANFVKKNIQSNLLTTKNYASFIEPISPHRCLQDREDKNKVFTDESVLTFLRDEIYNANSDFILIEGAGGIASPTIDGSLQIDLYRNIILPIIFIADSKLGGISATITAIEMAYSRGFEIACILLFEGNHKNASFLKLHYANKIPVIEFKNLDTEFNFDNWYMKNEELFQSCIETIYAFNRNKKAQIDKSLCIAKNHAWWPFTQHNNIKKINFIESAWNDDFHIYDEDSPHAVINSKSYFDGSASWWTQGLGHGNIALTNAAKYAAGRYGHVIFPGNIHLPASLLIEKLLGSVGKGWASRVFFSDNGSTAVEVAIKMAMRKLFGNAQAEIRPILLGLKDSYHGDTLGAMDATNPNIFKNNDHWYEPKGYWLDYPTIYLKNEKYFIEIPDFNGAIKIVETSFKNLDDVFSLKRADSAIFHNYLNSIEKVFHQIEENKMCIGACLLEGVVLGAGGMKFVDPLFQKILIEESQKRGIPVILDEVFTGFCRLGKRSAAELLNVRPDIACYAKLLTGGLLPMSVTLATEAIFNEFLGDDLTSALLHGHSYTATPIGCQVALEAIDELEQIILERSKSNEIFECWNRDLVNQLSNLSSVERVFSLGTLFVLELKDEKSGYNSSKSKEIIHQLRLFQIEARPLGNVIYLMAGFHTKDIILDSILNKLISTLYN